jgi:hypothetical protein
MAGGIRLKPGGPKPPGAAQQQSRLFAMPRS